MTSASGTIDLSWEASQYDGGSPILGYYVEYRLSTLTVFTKTSLISATDFATQLTALTADAEYAIRITAENIKGESIPSGLIYQYAAAVPATLSAPTLTSSTRTDFSLVVQWTAPGTSTTTVIG